MYNDSELADRESGDGEEDRVGLARRRIGMVNNYSRVTGRLLSVCTEQRTLCHGLESKFTKTDSSTKRKEKNEF